MTGEADYLEEDATAGAGRQGFSEPAPWKVRPIVTQCRSQSKSCVPQERQKG
jgi:hypothetical protein